jgi:formyl-CoA transferase
VQLVANSTALTAILDEAFGSQPIVHWREVFEQGHITYGVVRAPLEVVSDPQLRANDIVVPLEGAGGKLQFTISSPLQVHGIAKVPAKRAPDIGEHNEEILQQLGFDPKQIEAFRANGAVHEQRHAEEAKR